MNTSPNHVSRQDQASGFFLTEIYLPFSFQQTLYCIYKTVLIQIGQLGNSKAVFLICLI